jgi:hypothetical protein
MSQVTVMDINAPNAGIPMNITANTIIAQTTTIADMDMVTILVVAEAVRLLRLINEECVKTSSTVQLAWLRLMGALLFLHQWTMLLCHCPMRALPRPLGRSAM